MTVAHQSTHTSRKRVYAPCCRSASRLPGSRYARLISQPGPQKAQSLRHESTNRNEPSGFVRRCSGTSSSLGTSIASFATSSWFKAS